ncbi:50S ribosomal protein L29 [Patescibacteria group bacterium]|nr:50S ribosomal protein L29 [Patescibacteria group bacterium]
MKKTDKIAYKQKSTEELNKLLRDLKKKFVEAKSKQYLGNQKDTSVFKKIQSEIALISTLLNQNDR